MSALPRRRKDSSFRFLAHEDVSLGFEKGGIGFVFKFHLVANMSDVEAPEEVFEVRFGDFECIVDAF
jgi:hypothetical protein